MVLTPLDRGNLEKIIDNAIQNTQLAVNMARLDKYKKILNDKNGTDFVLGLALGQIQTTFILGFLTRNNRPLDQTEQNEAIEIAYKRIAEIKEAIFNCG